MAEEVGTAEASVLSGGGEMRFEGEEAVVAIVTELLQELGPVGDAFSCGGDVAVGKGVFDVDVFKPGAQGVVGVGVGYLIALDEVGGIEDGLEMDVVDGFEQVGAASNGVTVDVFFVFMEQDDAFGTCQFG